MNKKLCQTGDVQLLWYKIEFVKHAYDTMFYKLDLVSHHYKYLQMKDMS